MHPEPHKIRQAAALLDRGPYDVVHSHYGINANWAVALRRIVEQARQDPENTRIRESHYAAMIASAPREKRLGVPMAARSYRPNLDI